MVQLGSFGEEQNARRLADRVATFGLTAHVFPSTSNGSSVFRVRVGPTSSRQSAAAVAAFLSANGFDQPWVLNEPGQVVVYAAEPSPAPANIQTIAPTSPGVSPALEPAVSPTETVVEIGTKSVTIGRGNTPVIDGQLDEADWERATLVDDFHQLIPSLEKKCLEQGVEIKNNTSVKKIITAHNKATGVLLESGETIEGSIIISNADPKTTYFKLLGTEPLDTDFIRRAKNFRAKGNVAKFTITLDEKPIIKNIDKEESLSLQSSLNNKNK